MKVFAQWVMRGPVPATSVAVVSGALSWVLPPLIYFGSGALALLGMQLGAGRALMVAAAACVVLSLLSLVVMRDPWAGLLTGMLAFVPLALLGDVVRRAGSLSAGLQASMLLAMSVAMLAWVLPPEPVVWWAQQLQDLLERFGGGGSEGPSMEELEALAAVVPGLLGIAMLTGLFISLVLGRWWQAMLYNPGGFRGDFHALRAGRPLVLLVAASAALGLAGLALAGNVALAGVAGLAMYGLAVLHALAGRMPQGSLWLVPMYVLLVFALPYMAVMLAVVGTLDSALDLRARVGSGDS